ncbi:hypothetical protein BK816_04890 [Boudabousia tangfeifanii]|uniref:Glutamine amidotransferase domain-containing protein n=1 Tax=Boudabousia tangfeifanii TaxID=1912795 RepID=A0A1D9MKJ3_9ACTO|nr:type 1 glutamine amidotransferase [Boudabousia tangfeifanii]AOZ72709.1 hypothetical protein BK816_04890 [Boudabousia tangfeifanii]
MLTVFQPDISASKGRLPRWLRGLEIPFRLLPIHTKSDIPKRARSDEGFLILGGMMSAHSAHEHDWLPVLADFISRAVSESVPIIGVCLGAQISAEALGGQVAVPALGQDEVGLVSWTPNELSFQDPWLGPAIMAAQEAGAGASWSVSASHYDAILRLPPGADLLASSSRCPIHTWRFGSLLGFQHHPEMSAQRTADLQVAAMLKQGASAFEAKKQWLETVTLAAQSEEITNSFGRALLQSFAHSISKRK